MSANLHPSMPRYTAAELSGGDVKLPGLWAPAKIDPCNPQALFEGSAWKGVINLTALTGQITPDGSLRACVVTGSRAEEEKEHPNVASVPTMQIGDDKLFWEILRTEFALAKNPPEVTEFCLDGTQSKLVPVARFDPYLHSVTSPYNKLQTLCRKLMAKKLGFGAWYDPNNAAKLRKENFYPSIGDIGLMGLGAGLSPVGENEDKEPTFEPIIMVDVLMNVNYPFLFPRSTGAYNSISLTSYETFAANVRERNVSGILTLDRPTDEIGMCLYGLCTQATTATVEDRRLADVFWQYHLGFNFKDDPQYLAAVERHYHEQDSKGQELRAHTAAILGYDAFDRENVRFTRDG